MTRNARDCQKPQKRHGKVLSNSPLQEQPLPLLNFGLLDSQTIREKHVWFFSCAICGNLWWQPMETNKGIQNCYWMFLGMGVSILFFWKPRKESLRKMYSLLWVELCLSPTLYTIYRWSYVATRKAILEVRTEIWDWPFQGARHLEDRLLPPELLRQYISII